MPPPGSVLLLCSCVLLLQPGRGHDTNCSCNANSRCDETGVCRCDPGWDGPGCERCVPMPGCLHGSCHQPWQCSCQPGWAGRFCDKDIHVCSREKPCQNGATCVLDGGGEYSCLCPEGFHGRNCQLKAGPCHRRRSPCKNGGLCEDNGGFASELTCHCLAGFTGPRCETDLDDCSMKPCANGATCIDGVNRFSCLCPDGFTGRFCTVNLDDCASGPCLNGGRCLDRVGAFRCLCRPGFTGATCEVVLWSRKPDEHEPAWPSLGWEGGGGGVTRGRNRTSSSTGGNSGGDGSTTSSSFHGDRLFKVSVKEVVTQQGAVALSELQLVTLLVLGGITSAVVALTAGLVLRGRCRGRRASCRCWTLSWRPRWRGGGRPTPPQGGPTGSERECKISFLNGAEAQKKRLNSEVI
ncbi:protein delta homolog 2 [Myripristis murdjan]|uniref:protein delta homolog 2 n=1 Tax=Myripristis murdjan TaxID=586833 RepID=UPI0011763317|nr:protein delta homolog 2 [Myripristis murdjan]